MKDMSIQDLIRKLIELRCTIYKSNTTYHFLYRELDISVNENNIMINDCWIDFGSTIIKEVQDYYKKSPKKGLLKYLETSIIKDIRKKKLTKLKDD